MSRHRPPQTPRPTRRDFLRALAVPAAVAASLGCTGAQDMPAGPSRAEVPPPPPEVPMAPRASPALALLRAYRLDRVEPATVFRAGGDE
ncbi:MAG: twin-arginine translocation signal domain-containing protein [Anaeromyxobacteraceae bacterium]